LELALPEVVVDMWSRYQREVWVLGIASAAMLVISAMLIPYLIVRLPADFYAESNHRRRLFQDRPLLRVVFLAVKNTLGGLLLVAGILMLVLPGQGILTILAALALGKAGAGNAHPAQAGNIEQHQLSAAARRPGTAFVLIEKG
jgi:uncharacterized membrane protein SpoIIM required for sporulation